MSAHPFASPESTDGESAGPAGDIFGLGAIASTRITGVAPFESEFVLERVRKQIEWNRPDLRRFSDRGFPVELLELVEEMLDPDPARRPTAAEVLDRLDLVGDASDLEESSQAN